jgi:hypothetical protein
VRSHAPWRWVERAADKRWMNGRKSSCWCP